jgi:hypothetical protein
VLFEKGNYRQDSTGSYIDCKFVFPDGELLNEFRKRRDEVAAIGVERLGGCFVFICPVAGYVSGRNFDKGTRKGFTDSQSAL